MSNYFGCRVCRHFNLDGSCPAFAPRPIPLSIISGEIKHLTPLPGQANDIVYEHISELEAKERLEQLRALRVTV
ncbi:hypothetical protein RIF25_10440 [Thermosynechococcaceae cyanobacterium BACA0444]|uniref:Uncharacterized protein n=1 Tax=Pseudocalidococcus azoricus BACA0444 TaxID=2918990 RepID=A0AAE4JYQ3_9CYAN|nr:hypothetical protein [Pseudocalidococcus azoricus]MDS3861224.1 hypothetical protein [Pseudocalidococcus azoricus BACA0444]